MYIYMSINNTTGPDGPKDNTMITPYYTAGQHSATIKKDPDNFDEYKVQFYIGGVAEGTGYFARSGRCTGYSQGGM